MCFPLDIDIAHEMHAERTQALEVENRLALTAEARATARATPRRR